MAKLSQQIEAKKQPERPTRTERVFAQEQFRKKQQEKREFEEAKKEIESATYDNYRDVYFKIKPKYRQSFISPEELEQTEGYKRYQSEKRAREKINYIISKASKVDRGKPFVFWGDSSSDIALVRLYREGIGTGTKQERRARFLKQQFPEVEAGEINQIVNQGTVTDFGVSQKVYGLDVGETVTFTTKDQKTGEIKRVETYKRTSPTQIQKGLITEKDIAKAQKEAQEKAYQDFLEQDKKKPLYFDFEQVERPSSTFARRETISDQPRVDFIPIQPDQPQSSNKAFSTIKKYWDKIPEIPFYLNFGGGGLTPTPSLSVFKTDNSINLKEKKAEFQDYLSEKQQEQFEKEITRTGLKEDVDTTFQEEYQTRFERKYMKDLIFGEIDFEKAQEEFEQSDEAKIIGKKYQKAIEQGRAGQFTKEGFAISGLGLAKTGVTLVPTTVKGAVAEGVLIYTGAKVLKAIPPVVTNIGTAGIGTLGTFQAFSPTSSPEAKAGGVITAGVSFGILGVQGVQYLRRPTIRTESIAIKQSIDPKLQRGFVTKTGTRSVTDLAGKTTITDYYKANKLTEQIVYGRRTIVSTKFRDLLNIKPVYQGIPYQQRGTTYVLQGLRGTTTFTTPSGYQKALRLLEKRLGFTSSQARATLRYYQPKQIFSQYSADIVVKYGDLYKQPSITIKGARDITQPSTIIDDALGIKTRGASAVREYIRGRGTVVGSVKGRTLYQTTFDIEKAFLTPQGRAFQKLTQAGKTTKQFQQLTSVADKGDEVLRLEVRQRLGSISKDFPYSVFDEKTLAKQVIPRGKYSFGQSESAVFKRQVPRVDVDLREIYGINIKEDVIKRATKTSNVDKLQDPKYLKEVIKSLKNVYGDKQLKSFGANLPKTKSVAGAGGTSAVQEIRTTTQLKTTFNPVQAIKNQIKNIVKVGQKSTSLSSLGLASASASASAQRSAQVPQLKTSNLLKNLIKQDYGLKTSQTPVTRQAQLLSTVQALKLDQGLLNQPALITPTVTQPRFDFTPPTTPTLPFLFPSARGRGRTKRKSRQVQDLSYLPDFTARALGLQAESISEKQAKKKLKQILTGLEIRRPVKVRF